MPVRLLRVLLLLFFFCGGAYAAETDAYAYLNKIRIQAGMLPFSYHEQLALAALNHASYLHMHRLGGHGEQSGRRGFTGSSHIERIVRAGYPSRLTSENVSYHTGSV